MLRSWRLALIALFFLPALALAEVFELKDGSRIEGDVIRESGGLLSIRKNDGTVVTLEREQIAARRPSHTLYSDFVARKAKLSPKDAEAHFALANWCEEKGLRKEAELMHQLVLGIDPNHERSRAVLGYERIGTDWYRKGSPEAEARRRELAGGDSKGGAMEGGDVAAPEKKGPPRSSPEGKGAGVVAAAPTVHLVVTESVGGAKYESSEARARLQDLFSRLRDPLALAAPDADPAACDFVLEISLTAAYLRTHRFFGKVQLYKIYEYSANAVMRRASPEEEGVAQVKEFKEQMTVSLSLSNEEGEKFAYGEAWQLLMHFLSKTPFFSGRGAPEIPAPPR